MKTKRKNSSSESPALKKKTKISVFDEKLNEAKLLPMTKGKWSVAEALNHLGTIDSKFKSIIEKHAVPKRFISPSDTDNMTPYNTLVRSIVFQQLAGSVASSIYNKLCGAIKAKNGIITPLLMHNATCKVEMIDGKKKILVNGVAVGLSEAKLKYILSLTEHFLDPSKLRNFDLNTASDEELIEKLLAVKGLGMWSIHMFMMFHLHRPDVLPIGDLAVRKGICKLYALPSKMHESNSKVTWDSLKLQCQHWSPFASVGNHEMSEQT